MADQDLNVVNSHLAGTMHTIWGDGHTYNFDSICTKATDVTKTFVPP